MTVITTSRTLLLCVGLFLAGCGARAPTVASASDNGPTSGLAVKSVTSGELPPPQGVDLYSDARPYIVGPFDKLSINVFGVDALTRESVQVDAGGQLSFPLIGQVNVLGKTPEEVARIIADGLRNRFVRDPQVTVNLVDTVSRVITVDGEVNAPGLYPVVGKMTLVRAIATAKGVSEFAKLSDVIVFRSVGGQRMAGAYNLKAIRRGVYGDPEIFAGDVIVVGDSPSRRFLHNLFQAAPLLSTPLLILFQNI